MSCGKDETDNSNKVSRRDLIRIIGISSLFSVISLSLSTEALAVKVRESLPVAAGERVQAASPAVEDEPPTINVIWFEGQSCTGDTIALLDAVEPSIVDVLGGAIEAAGPVSLPFHDAVMPEWGDHALRILEDAAAGEYDPFVLVLEGAFPIDSAAGGPAHSDLFGYSGEEDEEPLTFLSWLKKLLPKAVAMVSIGNCASYGGIPANSVLEEIADYLGVLEKIRGLGWSRSPTGAVGFFSDPIREHKGLIDLLPEDVVGPYRRFIGGAELKPGEIREDVKPAMAVPGCPANGQGQIRALGSLVLWARGLLPLPPLDEYHRPTWIFEKTVHEQCPRAALYSVGDLREQPGQPTYQCLFKVGCKGPVTHCPWNKEGWVGGMGGPTKTGSICIGCTMPGFSDAYEPFFQALREEVIPPPVLPPATTSAAASIAGLIGMTAAGAITSYLLSKRGKKRGGEEQ